MQKRQSLGRRVGHLLRIFFLAPIAGLLAAYGVRFARISNPGRIGHMAAEIDCFLKERALGLIPDQRPILILERRRAGNRAMLDLIGQHVTVWDKRWQKLLFSELEKIPALSMPLGRPVLGLKEAARYSHVLALWGERPPLLKLPEAMQANGRARLAEMGLPSDAWFVSAHSRERGYWPGDDDNHAHRNADIASYEPAMRAIIERGGWIVRVGDPSMSPLPPMDHVIDYTQSPLKSEWMDLWLCANNRFFLGSSSGLSMVATIFDRPCVQVNMIPMGASLSMAARDISIPKRLQRQDGTVMRLAEHFASGLSVQRFAHVFDEAGLTILDNTGAEIRAITVEMMDRLDGDFDVTEDDEDLLRHYKAHFRAADYSFGSPARVGRDWLRENRDLL